MEESAPSSQDKAKRKEGPCSRRVTEEEGRSSDDTVAKARECFHYTPFIVRNFNLDILPGAYDASDDAADAWDDFFDSLDIIAQDGKTRRSKWRAF